MIASADPDSMASALEPFTAVSNAEMHITESGVRAQSTAKSKLFHVDVLMPNHVFDHFESTEDKIGVSTEKLGAIIQMLESDSQEVSHLRLSSEDGLMSISNRKMDLNVGLVDSDTITNVFDIPALDFDVKLTLQQSYFKTGLGACVDIGEEVVMGIDEDRHYTIMADNDIERVDMVLPPYEIRELKGIERGESIWLQFPGEIVNRFAQYIEGDVTIEMAENCPLVIRFERNNGQRIRLLVATKTLSL